MTEISKQERIQLKIDELKQIFAVLDVNTQTTVEPLISKAAFMSVTLDDLQDIINQTGVVEEYHNGANQHGLKKSSHVEVHLAMMKNYTSVMKQLMDLLPKEQVKIANDPLLDFINEPK